MTVYSTYGDARLTPKIDDATARVLDEIKHRAQLARPIWVMERAISHIGKEPGLATEAAIKILNRSIVKVLSERRVAR